MATPNCVRFYDAFLTGFDITPTPAGDLKLTRAGLTASHLFQYCLATVNGFLHPTAIQNGVFTIIGGATSGRLANNNQVGLLYFKDVGALTIANIPTANVWGGKSPLPLQEKVYVRAPSTLGTITTKTILFSLGGYLLLTNTELMYRAGEDFFAFEFLKYPWARRFLQMRKKISLADLVQGFTVNSINSSQVRVAELLSDATIRKLFALPQTFMIAVDTPTLTSQKTLVEFSGLTDTFITHEKPIYPLITGTGRLHEYHRRWEHDRWVLNTHGSNRSNYLFETMDWRSSLAISTERDPMNPVSSPQAYFWKLARGS